MVGRRDLGDDAVVEGDAVGVRLRGLVRMAEAQRPRRAVGAGCAAGQGGRHQLEGLPVAHPRARLVRQRECLQPRAVVGAIALLVLVDPVRAGIGHRRPEVEAVRHGHRGKVVAAREAAVGIGTAAGVDKVAGMSARVDRRGADAQVIQVALEAGGRAVVRQHDALDGAASSHRAHVDRKAVPLIRIQRAALALRARRRADTVLVARAAGGQPAAVVEHEVHRHVVGGVAQIARSGDGKDQVRQLRVRAHRQVHRVQRDLLWPAGVTAVVQRMQAAEADTGFRRERGRLVGAAFDGSVEACVVGRSRQRRRFGRLERTLQRRGHGRRRQPQPGGKSGQPQRESPTHRAPADDVACLDHGSPLHGRVISRSARRRRPAR